MTALRVPRRAVLLLALGLASLACSSDPGSGGDSFTDTPLTTVTSDSGKLSISVWTSPDQPPTRGILTLKLLVTDAQTHAPVDGLSFDIVPEMPSMGHGTSDVPSTAASGDGVYMVENVNLFMAGRWELRITIGGTVSDVAVVQIDVS